MGLEKHGLGAEPLDETGGRDGGGSYRSRAGRKGQDRKTVMDFE